MSQIFYDLTQFSIPFFIINIFKKKKRNTILHSLEKQLRLNDKRKKNLKKKNHKKQIFKSCKFYEKPI